VLRNPEHDASGRADGSNVASVPAVIGCCGRGNSGYSSQPRYNKTEPQRRPHILSLPRHHHLLEGALPRDGADAPLLRRWAAVPSAQQCRNGEAREDRQKPRRKTPYGTVRWLETGRHKDRQFYLSHFVTKSDVSPTRCGRLGLGARGRCGPGPCRTSSSR